MKKVCLLAMGLVPFAAGYLVNITVLAPVAGPLAFYVLPLAVMGFWFWLGRQYSKTGWSLCRALLLGHAVGLLSLALYLWQFVWQSSQTRDPLLAGLSQMYFSAAPQYLLGPIASLFPQPVTVLMLLSLLLMMAVFALGFSSGRKTR